MSGRRGFLKGLLVTLGGILGSLAAAPCFARCKPPESVAMALADDSNEVLICVLAYPNPSDLGWRDVEAAVSEYERTYRTLPGVLTVSPKDWFRLGAIARGGTPGGVTGYQAMELRRGDRTIPVFCRQEVGCGEIRVYPSIRKLYEVAGRR